MEKQSVYQYQPLVEPGAVRLIDLQPSPDLKSRVECIVIHTTLDKYDFDMIDHYTALSYVWGDSCERCTVSIDGCDFDVTANLHSALCHIRDPKRPRLIWADAICISQSDDQEKAIQVQQMRDVYKTAQHTIIYLGGATPQSESFMKRLGPINRSAHDYTATPSEALDLLNRPWLRRVWILQELVFSKDPWIHCGERRARWQRFEEAFETFRSETTEPYRTFFDMSETRKEASFRNYNVPLEVPEYLRLLHIILEKRRGLGVQDPRDMIFAHLGIIGGVLQEGKVQSYIMVDYTKSIKQIYEKVAALFMEHLEVSTATSCIRELDDNEPEHNDLASWCPDWSKAKPRGDQTTLSEAVHGARNHWPSLQPTKGLVIGTLSFDPSTLISKGYYFDTVRIVSATITSYKLSHLTINSRTRKRPEFLPSNMQFAESWEQFFPPLAPWMKQYYHENSLQHSIIGCKVINRLWMLSLDRCGYECWYTTTMFMSLFKAFTKGCRLAELSGGTIAIVSVKTAPGDLIGFMGERGRSDQVPIVFRPIEMEPQMNEIVDAEIDIKYNSWGRKKEIRHVRVVGETFVDEYSFADGWKDLKGVEEQIFALH